MLVFYIPSCQKIFPEFSGDISCEILDLLFFTLINPFWIGDSEAGEKAFIPKFGADIRILIAC
jgi:hypothetical protein